jgi:ribosomal protein L22
MSAADEKDEKDAPERAPRGRRPGKKKASKQPNAEQPASAEGSAADTASEAAGDTPREPPAADPPPAKSPPAKEPAASERRAEPAEKREKRQKRRARPARGSKPTPTRRVVRARARYVRTSARKARMICGQLRGKSVPEARAILAFTPREVARAWSKLLESAVANAESNHELLEDDLVVREAYADEGPTIRRFRPRAMGRATTIRKRTSHLTITLAAGSQTRTTKR